MSQYLEDELEKQRDDGIRNYVMNPCKHTGFESSTCDICGYPDPRKLIAKLNNTIVELRKRCRAAMAKYPNGANGCACLFDDDENQIQWCAPHAEMRDENKKLRDENKKLKERLDEKIR